MYLEGSAPETDQPVDAAGLNTGECPQESEKKSKKARKFDEDPIK